jgi:hypothetical protein
VLDDGLRQVLQHPTIKHSLAKLDVSNCKSITAAGLIIPPLVRLFSPFPTSCRTRVLIHWGVEPLHSWLHHGVRLS